MAENINDFAGWDDTDFFEEAVTIEDTNTDTSEEEKEKTPVKDEDKNKDESKEKDTDWSFNSEEDPSEKDNKSGSIKNVLSFMKSSSFINEETDIDSLDEEEATEVFEETIEGLVENKLNSIFKDLPEDLKSINKIAINGGDYRKLFNVSNSNIDIDSLDMEKEEDQIKMMKFSLKNKKYSDSYIDTQIDFLKSSEKLREAAEEEFNRYTEDNKTFIANQVKEAEANKKKIKDLLKNERESFKNIIFNEKKEVGSLKIPKEREKLLDYLTSRDIVFNNTNITKAQKDIFEILKNPEQLIQLSILLSNRDKEGNFNFDFLERTIKSKKVENLRNEHNVFKTSAIGSSHTKSLADYFD